MTTFDVIVLVCGCIVAACAVTATVYLGIILFGAEGKQRRAARTAMRDLDRAAARPHRHDWTMWSEPEVTRVFAHGADRSKALPIHRDYNQHRTCRECGLQDRKFVGRE